MSIAVTAYNKKRLHAQQKVNIIIDKVNNSKYNIMVESIAEQQNNLSLLSRDYNKTAFGKNTASLFQQYNLTFRDVAQLVARQFWEHRFSLQHPKVKTAESPLTVRI